MRVLIGYDASNCSHDAIEDLRRAGLPEATRALVLSVGELWLPPPSSYGMVTTDFAGGLGAVMLAAKENAAAGYDRLRNEFPSWNVEAESVCGSPARAILERAAEWKADLVVLGSHGRSGLGKVLLGSVSQKIASNAPCSVRIGRPRREPKDSIMRIVIGIDGSDASLAAVRSVASRAWPSGTEVRLVTAIGRHAAEGRELGAELDRVNGIHAPLFDALTNVGLDISTVVRPADPRTLLIHEADDWGTDSIFVGAGGPHTLDRLLFGTVVAAVTARAHCSVEIVREQ